MPDNYEQSVGMLQDYFCDDQICAILNSSDSTTANKMILDCLIERMSCREELLDLCDQLETISTSDQLISVIDNLRSGEYVVYSNFQYGKFCLLLIAVAFYFYHVIMIYSLAVKKGTALFKLASV